MKSQFRNWSDVRTFLAVVRQGSTLAASRKLGIAQPTVARRIEALEHELGLTLFERDTRGFRPTESARALLPLAEALEVAASAFAAKTRDLTRPRPIRITAASPNFSLRVMQILSEFTALQQRTVAEWRMLRTRSADVIRSRILSSGARMQPHLPWNFSNAFGRSIQ
jgi:DNA-binding transcriptional LysR family regulator